MTGGHVFRAFLSLMKLAVSVEGVASTSNVLGCWIQDSRIELLQSQLPSFLPPSPLLASVWTRAILAIHAKPRAALLALAFSAYLCFFVPIG